MCWGQFANPAAAAAYGVPVNTLAATVESNQQSSGTPDGSDYLDETLLGHITDDALLGNLMEGELDLLDCLFKEEPATVQVGAVKECSAETPEMTQPQPMNVVGPVCYRTKASDSASDHSVQTPDPEPDCQGNSSSETDKQPDVSSLRAQIMNGQVQGAQQQQFPQAAQAQLAAQQMAAAAAAAQMQMQINPQMGMLPNVAAMQMLAANQGMMMGSGFPFAPQVLMQPQLSFKMGTSKATAENDEAVERIKKKRRESAQRSRARKNQYMKALEVENKGLRAENSLLRECLLGYERQFGLKMPDIPHTQMAVRPLPDSFMHDMCD